MVVRALTVGKSHGSARVCTELEYGLARGHLEFNEIFEACAARKAGRKATNDATADVGRYCVTVFGTARLADSVAEVRLIEPDKCEEWS